MKKRMALACHAILFVIVISMAMPSIATAAEQPSATLSPHPTTLGQTTEKINSTFYLMLVGACITLGGGLLVFRRYSK